MIGDGSVKKQYIISLSEACDIIKKGGLVAAPTETVYGLAGSALDEKALKKIFQIKKRPFFNPLIVHCADIKQASLFHTVKHKLLKKMINHFCPGPLTFVLNKTKAVHPLITAGQNKVALRIPRHPLTLKLIKKTTALCAPSANLFKQLSPTRPEHIHHIFKGKVPVLNGGECQGGLESTVLEPDFKNRELKILRPGLITKENLQKWLKKEKQINWTVSEKQSPLSPGSLKKHYRPAVPLVLITAGGQAPTKKEVVNYLKTLYPGRIFKALTLKAPARLCARKLYHEMNILSQNPSHIIYAIKTARHKKGVWRAIENRLNKACSHKIPWPLKEKLKPA